MDLRNEYAHVHVELDNSGNGPRLLIRMSGEAERSTWIRWSCRP